MKNRGSGFIYIVLGVVLALLTSVGCSRRTQISDGELAQIFHDAFLANAYSTEKGLSLDSLRLYEPIFNSYGYTTEDVQYTIGSFATRKSARLSDVVERAISMLERRGEALDKHIDVLNSIDDMAKSRSMRLIYSDSVVRYIDRHDSMKVMIRLDSLDAGKYNISFDYLIDTVDKATKVYIARSWVETNEWDSEQDTLLINRSKEVSSTLRKDAIAQITQNHTIDNAGGRLMVALLSNKDTTTLSRSVTIKNIEIHQTLNIEQAREWLYQGLLGIKIYDDEFLFE